MGKIDLKRSEYPCEGVYGDRESRSRHNLSLESLVCPRKKDSLERLRDALLPPLAPLFHPLLEPLDGCRSLAEQQQRRMSQVLVPNTRGLGEHPYSSDPALQFVPFLGVDEGLRDPWTVDDIMCQRP